MKYKIVRINSKTTINRQLLRVLQRHCLPADTVHSVMVGDWWVAQDEEGRDVGFAGMTQKGTSGYLCRSGVVESCRGNGLQKRLIKAREAQARKLGYTELISDTTGNPPSSNSLISCGFKVYEPEEPWGGSKTIYWIKKLKDKK